MSNISEKLFVLVGFLILHLRPAIPGQLFGGFYLIGTVAFMAILFYLDRKVLLKEKSFFIFWYILLLGYLLFSSMNSSENFVQGIKTVVIDVFPLCWFSVMTPRRGYVFLKSFVNFFYYLTLSALVSYTLILLFDIRLELLKVNLETIAGRTNYIFTMYFPFTFVYSSESYFLGLNFPRFIGFFREPGILQVLLIFSYYIVGLFFKGFKALKYKLVLFLGFFLTFSTAGFIGFFVSETLRILFYSDVGHRFKLFKRSFFIMLAVFVSIGFYYVLFESELSFNVAAKMSRNSGASRVASIFTSLEYFRLKPLFGYGLFYFGEPAPFENVNLITALSEIGAFGVGFVILGYIILLMKSFKARSVAFLIGINLFLLVLLSQPIYLLPISFFILTILWFLTNNADTLEEQRRVGADVIC